MSNLALFQQPGQASSRFYKLCAQVLSHSSKRHQSSYRRTRQKLNVKPDASFLPSKTEAHDHIIYNPPPSMPNVYHTPLIFLPKNDRRRQLQKAVTGSEASSDVVLSRSTAVAPPVREPYEKRYHVTPEEMDEMRELRKEDPYKWSVTQLAKKYDCSRVFVGWVVEGIAKEKGQQQRIVTEVVKSRWGQKRRIAREDRAIRKERWYRDA